MLRGAQACELTGIPEPHAEAFQEVADRTRFVIASRAVGKYATGLILENYASKGFHNKAKSCNWGPMAGFVLADPRFTKVGGTDEGVASQVKALKSAFHEHAIAVPLYISDERRRWVEQNVKMSLISVTPNRRNYRAVSPWGLLLKFTLVRERPPGGNGEMWRIYYHSTETEGARGQQVGPYSGESELGLISVLAMRDPLCTVRISDYRAATTGDYDLFFVFARESSYSPDNGDRRMVSHAQLESNIRQGLNPGEDVHLGNITPRVRAVRDQLNIAIQRKGYTGGNMVHHSDEGGRPFVEDVDLPVFVVVPGAGEAFGIRSIEDMRQFITEEIRGVYAPVLHPGWMKQMVFHSSLDVATQHRNAIRMGALRREIRQRVPRQG